MSDVFNFDEMSETEIESKARAQGWKPEDEYTGKAGWKPARDFLEKSQRDAGIAISQVRDLTAKVEDLTGQLASMTSQLNDRDATFKAFQEHHDKQIKIAYERGKKALADKQREAVEQQDKKAFDEAKQAEDDLDEEYQKSQVTIAAKGNNQNDIEAEMRAGYEEWMADPANAWWRGESPEEIQMQAFANTAGETMLRNRTKLVGRAFYDAVGDKVRAGFPDYFRNTKRDAPPSVEGGGGLGREQRGEKSWENIPAEHRIDAERFIKEGLLTREKYVKEYFGDYD